MGINPKTVQETHKLKDFVHEKAKNYLHSKPLAVSRPGLVLPGKVKHPFKIEYDIKDIFVIGSITESSILMTGGTDLGKTTLAKLIMNALFGKEEQGWHRFDVDTDFGKDSFSNVDFSVIKEGGSTEGLYSASNFLSLPGLILDEINRTHSKLGNKLLHFFDKDITLPNGKRVKLGHLLSDERTYQFHITAINEGEEYGGTFGIDKALRRRTVIEIPMDIFMPTAFDRFRAQKEGIKIALNNEASSLEQVLKINNIVTDNLTLHPIAELFVAYLESFDYCKHSLTEEKGGVASKGGSIHHVCTQPTLLRGEEIGTNVGCEFLRSFENQLCPYVRGLSMGVSKNLRTVAKGFALLRAAKFVEMIDGHLRGVNIAPLSYEIEKPEMFKKSLQQYAGRELEGEELGKAVIAKYFEQLEVEKEDIDAALGFVGYSKVGIANAWVSKFYQGNRFGAIKNFSSEATQKLEEGLSRPELSDLQRVLNGESSDENLASIEVYCRKENPWLWEALSPYIHKQKLKKQENRILELYEV